MKSIIICMTTIVMTATSCSNGNHENKAAAITDMALKESGNIRDKVVSDDIATMDTATTVTPLILQNGQQTNIDWDKKIIKTARITLELKDYNNYNATLHTKLKGYGAYIAQEQQAQTDDELTNTVMIKVPVEQFENLMNSLPDDGIKVVEKNISSEDVTGEVVDTKARLEAKTGT